MKKDKKYPYGLSLINTNYKYDFGSLHSNLELKDLIFECKIYLKDKLVKTFVFEKLVQQTVGETITSIMKRKVEKSYKFKKKGHYRVYFYGYISKKIIRRLYKQTSNYIETFRKEYIIREMVNITV